jgi:5'-methylthioadenosine phosphorylase
LVEGPKIGVIGGSGFYALFETGKEVEVDTPFGKPSDKITIGEIAGTPTAFLPRHGKKHSYPPHSIPYRANIFGLHKLGVERILAPAAAGSLDPTIKPGDFVVVDQFVHFTNGRRDTFYDGPETLHVSTADPYCPELRKILLEGAQNQGIRTHPSGTVVVIQGPRFSTRAESRFFSNQGWSVINMTQYPENVLARELEMCYANISLITDYDVGLEGSPEIAPVTSDMVVEVFKRNNSKLKALLHQVIPKIPIKRSCNCATALKGARV